MTREQHIQDAVTKLSSVCFLIRQLRNIVSIDILRVIYYAHVQSVFPYGLIFWGSPAHMHYVFMMQKKILSSVKGVHLSTPCKELVITSGF